MKVPLAPSPYQDVGWRSPMVTEVPITSALPFWRARKGWKIHRPRFATIIYHYGRWSHVNFRWLCQGSTNDPIPLDFRQHGKALSMCGPCEGLNHYP